MLRRFGFLPVFFTVLSIVFVIAVVLRIRSYESEEVHATATATATAGRSASADPGSLSPDGSEQPGERTMTLLELPNATAPPSLSIVEEPPPPAPAEKPSLLTRILHPIASRQATRPAPPPPAPAPPQAAQPASQPRTQPQTETREAAENSDPTSDSTPPRLLSIVFNPPQIQDGQETMLIVEAVDELSGVRSISGTIVAPSGAVQGFACQREGETGRYFARVSVPKDAAEGIWAVNYVNLMDNASNAAPIASTRSGLLASATFRVISSRPDSQGPTLKAIWIDRRVMRGGEKNSVHVQAEDDKSGLNLISGIFQSPSRVARVGFVCRAAGDGSWTCEFAAPDCADCGEWHLEQLQMQDKANNMTTLRAQANEMVSAIRVEISSDACDATPPAVEAVVLDQTAVSNADPSTITVTATLSDDRCGVLSVSGQATGPSLGGQAPRLYFSFTASGDPHTWVGRIAVPRLAAKGTWRISFLQVLDRGQNLKAYSQADPVLANAAFQVQ
jgi:hypothetical protein